MCGGNSACARSRVEDSVAGPFASSGSRGIWDISQAGKRSYRLSFSVLLPRSTTLPDMLPCLPKEVGWRAGAGTLKPVLTTSLLPPVGPFSGSKGCRFPTLCGQSIPPGTRPPVPTSLQASENPLTAKEPKSCVGAPGSGLQPSLSWIGSNSFINQRPGERGAR